MKLVRLCERMNDNNNSHDKTMPFAERIFSDKTHKCAAETNEKSEKTINQHENFHRRCSPVRVAPILNAMQTW